MFNSIKKFYQDFQSINKINFEKPKIVFYSENKSYQKYGYNLIEYFSKKFPGKVYYISSDKYDRIKELEVTNVYIKSYFLLQYLFLNIKADNLFLTVTDLGNATLKKNKNVKNYIYYFHGAVSTTKVFREKAFDNYDTILCNGNYHINEIRQRESIEGLNQKNLIKSGYLYFDYLKNRVNNPTNHQSEILIAPSWNKDKKNYLNQDFEKIIKELLKHNYKVRFRPHPETIKRFPKIKTIYNNLFNNENFIFDDNSDNLDSMQRAQCLITENSGISIEFLLIFKKPVIFYTDSEKTHNTKYNMYKNLNTMEDIVKNKFGHRFNYDQISNINNIIKSSAKNFDKSDIDNILNENFYNYKHIIDYIDNNLSKICV